MKHIRDNMPNVTVPMIDVPESLSPTSTRSTLYKTLLALGLKEAGQPDGTDAPPVTRLAGLRHGTIFFPDITLAKLSAFASRHDITLHDAFARLCALGLEKLRQGRQDMNARVLVADAPPFKNAHKGQSTFYRQAIASLSANRICLNEASTGSGKSRAMAAVAIHQANRQENPGVIAAPTL
ncbi:CRISPR-associated DEAD/DEAH-box helicase Csf4, partial [mine drainage metagenome]